MSLQLNEPTIDYKEFCGRNIDQMPKLIAEGRTPLSFSGVMTRMLETQHASQVVRDSWLHNYFDTGDGIAYHPDGRIKVVLDAQPLREINSQSKLKNGALALPDGMYEALEGQEFTRGDIKKYVGDWISAKEAKSNPLWQALARDTKLLNDYVDLIFAQAKQQFGYDKNMGVYVIDTPSVPSVRPWVVNSLNLRSYANGYGSLDGGCGRLVGVAAEPLVERENVEGSKIVAPNLEQLVLVLTNSEHIAPASRKAVLAEVERLYIQ